MKESPYAMPFMHECSHGFDINNGVSTRLFVAMHILSGINASIDPNKQVPPDSVVVRWAVSQADLLIAEIGIQKQLDAALANGENQQ